MKKNSKKEKRKQQIISLAEEATEKINQNKILSGQIDNYNKHIQMIKSFMNKCSENNKLTESLPNNKNEFIKNEFKNYYKKLNQSIKELIESSKKIKQKYENNSDIYFDDASEQNKVDAFILSYSLEQKVNVIKKLKESIHFSKDYNIFREPKRETLIEMKNSEDYIDDINKE